jgi:hypothetical protein
MPTNREYRRFIERVSKDENISAQKAFKILADMAGDSVSAKSVTNWYYGVGRINTAAWKYWHLKMYGEDV